MKTSICLLILLSRLACAQGPAVSELLKPYAEEVGKWEKDIQKFEALDRKESYPKDAVLFMGSSSIRIWNTIAEDMKPYVPIQRGFGGSKFSDLAWYIDRIVQPQRFRAAVIFVGNDVKGAANDKDPAELMPLVKHVVKRIQVREPDAPVFLIAVTPTSSRWKHWAQARANNEAMRHYAEATPGVHYIATEDAYLGEDGKPNDALFKDDKLHLNREGYLVWRGLIRKALDAVR